MNKKHQLKKINNKRKNKFKKNNSYEKNSINVIGEK